MIPRFLWVLDHVQSPTRHAHYSFLKDLFFLITLYFPWFYPAVYHLLYTLVERQPPFSPYYRLAV